MTVSTASHRTDSSPRVGSATNRVRVLSPVELVCAGLRSILATSDLGQTREDQPRGTAPRPGEPTVRRYDVVLADSASLESPLLGHFVALVRQPDLVVMVLAREQRPALTDRALDLGADGCLPLVAPRADLVAAVVAARRRCLHGDDVPDTVDYRVNPYPAVVGQPAGSLSVREVQVLALITRGLTNREIAQHLFVSQNTVKTYTRTAYQKISVGSRTQAILWGLQHRVSDLERRDRLVGVRDWASRDWCSR